MWHATSNALLMPARLLLPSPQLGIVSHAQAQILLHFTPLARPSTLDHRASRSSGVATVVTFLKGLASLQGRVPDEATRRNRWGPAGDLVPSLPCCCG